MQVSVLIPTFRRPDSFARAARSVFAQVGVADFEIVAVDNSPEGSALDTCRKLAEEAPCAFRWAHAPAPGVAHARNAAISLARGTYVAWLDDDEEAPPTWLAALIAQRRATGAQSVFGPVKARAPAHTRHAAFFERLYSRSGPARSGPIPQPHGIGNSLQPRAMFDEAQPFDPRTNETGGEDDGLFASWREAGATFAWAADACVTEHLDPSRARLAHGLRRAFAYGQGPCELAWSQRRFGALLRHMIVGVAQASVFGAITAVLLPFATGRAALTADRAVRGAGKVFWFLTQRFYGAALARQPA